MTDKEARRAAACALIVCLFCGIRQGHAEKGQADSDPQENLLVNADFEDWTDGSLDHWGFSTSNTITRSAKDEGYDKKGCAAVLEKTGEEAAWFWQLPSAPPRSVQFKVGQYLRFSVWLKLHEDSPEGRVSIHVGNVDGLASRADQRDTGALFSDNLRRVQPIKGEYRKFEVTHSIQPGAKSFCAAISTDEPLKFYVDKATFQFVPKPPPQPIDYITKKIPRIELPAYEGQRYRATVPDTLDLAKMAELTIHAITSVTDPEKDYEIYWHVVMRGNRPVMSRDLNHQVQLVMQRGIPFNRLVCGSSENTNVEKRWLEVLFHLEGPDGLLYYPLGGRPWINYSGSSGGQYDDFKGDQYTGPLNNGLSVEVLGIYYALTGDERIKELGTKVVDGMVRQAVHRKDPDDGRTFAFFAKGIYGLSQVSDPEAPLPHFHKGAALGWAAYDLVRFYKATDYKPALDFAGELARYVQKHSGLFGPDGKWAGNRHFPWHCGCLMGLVDYAIEAGDDDMLQYVRKSYDYAKAPEQHGDLILGWFPETAIGAGQTAENCGVSLMLNLAVKLSLASAGDYWDDVDRWTRNNFAENQLTQCECLYPEGKDHLPPVTKAVSWTDEDVGEKNIGGYAGWAAPNDLLGHGRGPIFMHCCIGEACMTVHRVWDNILHFHDGKLKVNLLMNRASPWADVDSYIPYQGRVDVKIKQACDCSVRIPQWVAPEETRVAVDGKARKVTFGGRYAQIGRVEPENVVTLTFPIFERTDKVTIQGKDYTLIRKGNDVVHIDPPGEYCPLYQQRQRYRDNKPHTKQVERFVAEQQIAW